MNGMDAAQRKKGIRMAGIAIGLMMAPVCALAQTVATATSQAPVYRQAVPPAAYYYGPDMMGGWGSGYYGPGMMGGFGLFWGLLWLLVIVGRGWRCLADTRGFCLQTSSWVRERRE